jgi:hypothetical protein
MRLRRQAGGGRIANSYACVAETPNDDFLKTWEMLRIALMGADHGLTRAELLEDWPEKQKRGRESLFLMDLSSIRKTL